MNRPQSVIPWRGRRLFSSLIVLNGLCYRSVTGRAARRPIPQLLGRQGNRGAMCDNMIGVGRQARSLDDVESLAIALLAAVKEARSSGLAVSASQFRRYDQTGPSVDGDSITRGPLSCSPAVRCQERDSNPHSLTGKGF